jgi:hypothetical protein
MSKMNASRRVIYDDKRFNSNAELKVYKILCKLFRPDEIFVNVYIAGKQIDIFLPHLKVGFEIQGPQHVFELDQITRDVLKKNFFQREYGIIIKYLLSHNISKKLILTKLNPILCEG